MSQTKRALEAIYEQLEQQNTMLEAIQQALGIVLEKNKAVAEDLTQRIERLEAFEKDRASSARVQPS